MNEKGKELSKKRIMKDHDKMTEHELRTEVLLLRAELNRIQNPLKPKVTKAELFDFNERLRHKSLRSAQENCIRRFLESKGVEIEDK